jgi:hypothetical protein
MFTLLWTGKYIFAALKILKRGTLSVVTTTFGSQLFGIPLPGEQHEDKKLHR